MNIYQSLNSFLGAGITSAIIGYIVNFSDPLIAAILWTLPFTIFFPIYNLHKNKKSNKFISTFLKTQSYTLFLLIIYLFSAAYFVEHAKKSEGILIPLAKGAGIWLVVSILYYIIMKLIAKHKSYFHHIKPKHLRFH